MPIEFYFTPELHLKDGRIIRDLDDAASFAREQEVRPGVDQRDEVLHKIERAEDRRSPCSGARVRAMDGGTRRSGLEPVEPSAPEEREQEMIGQGTSGRPRPGRRMSAGECWKTRSRAAAHGAAGENEGSGPCNSRQLAALRITPFRSATVDSFLSAAFSSLRLVVKRRTRSSRPSSSAQAIRVP